MAKKQTKSPISPSTAGVPTPSATVPAVSTAGESPSIPCKRNPDGTFAKGHAQIGHIQKGQKQKLSVTIQNQVLTMISNEVSSDRFQKGLTDLYAEDPKSYYQVITGLMKFCAPTLQSQSIEIEDTKAIRTIDDRLDALLHSTLPKQN